MANRCSIISYLRAVLSVLIFIAASGCGPAIDGVVSVGVPTLDNSLTERDATNAAEALIRYAFSNTNVWTPLPKTNAIPTERFLHRDPIHPNRASLRLANHGFTPALVRLELKTNHWMTATLDRWP